MTPLLAVIGNHDHLFGSVAIASALALFFALFIYGLCVAAGRDGVEDEDQRSVKEWLAEGEGVRTPETQRRGWRS